MLGAQTSAQDAAATSNITNAFLAAQVFYTDYGSYKSISGPVLDSLQPALLFVTDGSVLSSVPNGVEVLHDTPKKAVCRFELLGFKHLFWGKRQSLIRLKTFT